MDLLDLCSSMIRLDAENQLSQFPRRTVAQFEIVTILHHPNFTTKLVTWDHATSYQLYDSISPTFTRLQPSYHQVVATSVHGYLYNSGPPTTLQHFFSTEASASSSSTLGLLEFRLEQGTVYIKSTTHHLSPAITPHRNGNFWLKCSKSHPHA